MVTIANELSERVLLRVELDEDRELGLSDTGELAELAAREAACLLCWHWDSQFFGVDPKIVKRDVDLAIQHLERWRDNLIANTERPDLQ